MVALSSTERSPVVLDILRIGGGSRRILYMRYATRRSRQCQVRVKAPGGGARRPFKTVCLCRAWDNRLESAVSDFFRLDDASR